MKRHNLVWIGIVLVASLALVVHFAANGDAGERGASSVGPVVKLRVTNQGVTPVYKMAEFDPTFYRAARPGRKGAPLRFAEASDVSITPDTHGVWKSDGELAVWSLEVQAPGALNLNFGFRRFRLPESGSLELRNADGDLLVRPFTNADNEEHGELWTPVLEGEAVELVVAVAEPDRDRVGLELGAINRGFRAVSFASGIRKIGNSGTDGNCYIDVVCSAEESGVGALIDSYREQIRAAGVYTLAGVDTCGGVAVNNTENDGRPFFITADHCGVRTANAASMVVYWNHENSTCRAPGSGSNSGNGDGPITDFNSGAIFRASYTPADATLVELDDPLDPDHNVFLAGWSRTGTPRSTVSVHHPNISEKRISFDFDAAQSTGDSTTASDPNGTHWRVVDWDFGSTEGGSSGSPLFDQDGRLVGQLTGGDAACGNDLSDWYGKLARAWTGGGTASSRLSIWLDPAGTGALTLDGREAAGVVVRIAAAQVTEGDAGMVQLQFVVELSEAAEEVIDLSYSTQDGTATAGSDYVAASSASLSFPIGATSRLIEVAVNGDTDPEEHEWFKVILSLGGGGGSGATVGRGEGIGTILNDDFIDPVIVSPTSVNGVAVEEMTVKVVAQNTPTTFSLSDEPVGMTIDSAGVITWVPEMAGSFPVMVTASNPAGSDTETITFVITANPLAGAVESTAGMTFRTGGSAEWVRNVGGAVRGGDVARSGTVQDDQFSWLEVEVEGPDYLGFWWKVSSEEDFDFLSLEVDGEARSRISGTVDWQYWVVAIGPGGHVVRWSFAKDGSISEGQDRGWVDFVQLASQSVPFLMEPTRVWVEAGSPADYQFPTFRPDATFGTAALPGGVSLNGAGELGGTPTGPGRHDFTLEVRQEGNSVMVPATVEVIESAPLGGAIEEPDLLWSVSGEGNWIISTESRVGGTSVRETGVGDDESAILTTRVFGPGELSFWWKVSSELDFDYLTFELDGYEVDAISGSIDWTEVTVDLSYGPHELSWIYSKDESVSEGQDRGWVDAVRLGGYAGWIQGQGVGGRTNVIFDLDRDGQNHFFEYATGGSAQAWDPMPLAEVVNGALEWSLDKPAGRSGVAFDAEVGGDLSDWNRTERSIVQDDEERFRARDGFGVGVRGQRFMRGTVHPVK